VCVLDQPIETKPRIGTVLRAKRQDCGLTLKQVAERTGLSQGFLSQVENDKATPSLSSLVQIGRALGTDISELLFVPPADSIATYGAHRRQYKIGVGAGSYERISSSFPGNKLNGLIITVPPLYSCERQVHDGEEMYFVIDGKINCEVDGENYVLNAGDSIHFGSNIPHLYANPTTQPAKVIWVGTLRLFGEEAPKR
jgi:transcriptional regulator with XRE-family HTH domain